MATQIHGQLTPAVVDAICDAVEQGEWPQRAAVRQGYAQRTVADWLSLGRDIMNEAREIQTEHQEMCAALIVGIDYAEAVCEDRWRRECEAAIQKCIEDGKGSGWTGKMTMLERRFPDRWKKQTGAPEGLGRPEDAFARLQAAESPKS